MSTITACSEEKRFAFHGVDYYQAVDMPQVDILDCLYGDGLGAHTRQEVESGKARRGENCGTAGNMPIGDFLYVKWRDKATGRVYEDRVDLRQRLPSPKEMHDTTVTFLIDENQLYVYLVPRYDTETKLNYLPPGKPPNGPDRYSFLDVKTLYPENAPPKVRGGYPSARAAREAAEKGKP